MQSIFSLIVYYISLCCISVILINSYCPMRRCTYSYAIEYAWLVLLCIPFIYQNVFLHKKATKLIVFLIILMAVYLYGIFSSIAFLFLAIVSFCKISSKLDGFFNFIIASLLSVFAYVFYVFYIKGVFI